LELAQSLGKRFAVEAGVVNNLNAACLKLLDPLLAELISYEDIDLWCS
jgi:hypothetical protein